MSKKVFKVGDLVQLAKLHGPQMLVVDESGKKGIVACLWFNTENTLQIGTFPACIVEAVPPSPESVHAVSAGIVHEETYEEAPI